MKKYFIIDGFRRLGPFDENELKNQNISPDTILWTFETGEKKASEFVELSGIWQSNVAEKTTLSDETEKQKKLLEEYEKLKKDQEEKKKQEELQQKKDETPPSKDIQYQPIGVQDSEQKSEKDNQQPIVQEDKPQIEENVKNKQNEYTYQSVFGGEKYNKDYSSDTKIISQLSDTDTPKNTYFVLSLLNLILCCLPLGIVAIIFSSNAKKSFEAGNNIEGKNNAQIALFINIVSMAIGLIMWIIILAKS